AGAPPRVRGFPPHGGESWERDERERSEKMLEVDAAMGTLTIPIWAAGALSAVFLALVVLAIGRAGVAASVNVLFRVAIVAMAVSAGWLYIQRLERQEQATELRPFHERSAAFFSPPAP